MLPEVEEEVKKLYLPVIPNSYICMHPGSRGSSYQWPPHYFAYIADSCIEKGYTAIITGTKEEKDITREVIKCMRHSAIDLTGCTSTEAMAWLINNSFMLVANCTGALYMASIIQSPGVIICMDGKPERWKPANRRLHTVIDWMKTPYPEVVFNAVETIFTKQNALRA
ncbi:glycosyl transferase, family 9 [Filimonas lacunae]|nr:glycosyl transferase, family 9 [Filimonas lacunae]